MSEVYWIAGGEIKLPVANLSEELAAAGIRPGWIDEAHWISMDGSQPPEIHEALPTYRWPVNTFNAHRLLHFLISDLLSSGREILILGEIGLEQASFALLGDPKAAGRHNLLPRFRLSALPSFREDNSNNRLSRWSQHLEGLLIESHQIAWICAPGLSDPIPTASFPKAQSIITAPKAGLLNPLHLLVSHLEETRSPAGLLIENDPNACATLIERI